MPDLAVLVDDIKLRKTKANAFLDTNLDAILKSMKIDNLIICGYATEYCIDSTVRFALAIGYTIQLIVDAHTTTDKAHLSAEQIRHHHTITLAMSPTVTAVLSSDILLENLH